MFHTQLLILLSAPPFHYVTSLPFNLYAIQGLSAVHRKLIEEDGHTIPRRSISDS